MSATSESTYFERVVSQLIEIGYRSATPPKPLTWDAAIDTIGHRQASSATAESPCCLGIATVIALGNGPHAPAVIELEGRGEYYGTINHDLYFADPQPESQGLLHYANNYYVLAPPNYPRTEIIRLMRSLHSAR